MVGKTYVMTNTWYYVGNYGQKLEKLEIGELI